MSLNIHCVTTIKIIKTVTHEVKVFYIKYLILKCDCTTRLLSSGIILLKLLLHISSLVLFFIVYFMSLSQELDYIALMVG
jgi:hypothetical protein